jgi:hypothetical protein
MLNTWASRRPAAHHSQLSGGLIINGAPDQGRLVEQQFVDQFVVGYRLGLKLGEQADLTRTRPKR